MAHLVTNTVVAADGERVTARSKFLGVQRDGSGTYEDVLLRTPSGWRISGRRITLRREPLTP